MPAEPATPDAPQPAAIEYRLDLAIDSGADRVHGTWCMAVDLREASQGLVLDYRGEASTDALEINGVSVPASRSASRLVIPARALRPGHNLLAMPVSSQIAPSGTPLLRCDDPDDGAAYVYSLFVPADASALFPCIDHPHAKARFRLSLSLPPRWTAVSCAPVLRADRERLEFDVTPLLPTYAFAFAAGPFVVIEGDRGTYPARAFVRASRRGRIDADALEALRLSGEAVAWGERFFGFAFPFAKHDLVLLPAFPFGGMEHAGATFLDEAVIAIGMEAKEGARRRRAHLVFHETVHQWVGDCVTMRSFDDLWLKEGFANLGAALVAESADPTLQPWLGFQRLKAAAARQDVTAGAVPVRRRISQPADAKALYGPGVYGKAPALLRQARYLVGEAAFARGVGAFVRDHAYGAAGCDDLGAAVATSSGRPMREWLHAWLDRTGAPTVRLEIEPHDGRVGAARVIREDASGAEHLRIQRLEAAAIDADGAERRTAFLLDRAIVELSEWRGRPLPRIAFANAGDYGYGRFLLDPATRDAALADLGVVTDPLLRLQLVEALWEHVRDAQLDPARFVAFALARLQREPEWGVGAAIVEHAETATARYIDAGQRSASRPALETARCALGLSRPVPDDPVCRAFVARAAIADAAEKARCFDTFLHDATLPDRWVEAAAERFNDVDQSWLTLPYLRPALDALPALAKRRRIFFVDRWLGAFFGGQVSAAALKEVETFLAETALPQDLRMKVLEHADELARTVRIRSRYAARP